jgi:putative ABC transport system substrate-binding protein
VKTRRTFIITAAAWPALAWAGAVLAQSKQPILIGWLHADSRESSADYLSAFKEGLAALGWKEGSQIVIEERWGDARDARLQPLAEELAAKKPAIIVAAPTTAIPAAAKAAPKTPIVMASGSDPVAWGLVKSLARPGGMITGLTNFNINISEKYIELLVAAAPKVKRVGVLSGTNLNVPGRALATEAVRRSAVQYSVEARFAEVAKPEDIEPAIARLAKEGAQALVVLLSPILRVERRRIVKLALAQRWPVVAGVREYAEEGALLSYSADALANYRRAAYYVDRILKGAKPADLPIEQSTKFELVINLKTAKALKLDIPRDLAVRANRVIE